MNAIAATPKILSILKRVQTPPLLDHQPPEVESRSRYLRGSSSSPPSSPSSRTGAKRTDDAPSTGWPGARQSTRPLGDRAGLAAVVVVVVVVGGVSRDADAERREVDGAWRRWWWHLPLHYRPRRREEKRAALAIGYP